MNYLGHYIRLVRKAKYRQKHNPLTGYTESHHVFPVSIQKLRKKPKSWYDRKNNKIQLTAKEHFIAHLLLWKFCQKCYKNGKFTKMMSFACWTMTNVHNKKINSKIYETLRQEMSKNMSKMIKTYNKTHKNPMLGKHHTKEIRELLSKQKKEYYKTHKSQFYGKRHTEETKNKLSIAHKNSYKNGRIHPNKGKKFSEERKKSQSEFMKNAFASGKRIHPCLNRPRTQETKDKLSKYFNKVYTIIDVNGIVVICDNLKLFCKNNNLYYTNLWRTLKSQKFYKNYKITEQNNANKQQTSNKSQI